jgi:hypothetical protein
MFASVAPVIKKGKCPRISFTYGENYVELGQLPPFKVMKDAMKGVGTDKCRVYKDVWMSFGDSLFCGGKVVSCPIKISYKCDGFVSIHSFEINQEGFDRMISVAEDIADFTSDSESDY